MPKKPGRATSPAARSKSPAGRNKQAKAALAPTTTAAGAGDDVPPPVGYLIECDIPTKQYIRYLNVLKEPNDKKFISQDLDPTHLLVKEQYKDEILAQVEAWEDSNVYSAVEKVGEDFDMS
mmetsp:Transcript_28599/g.59752  ORF Transcript_28599/g.59752 Transcript_28599/m.59752 type:complete len:121 (-) Transcript_28599:9-371(-)